MARLGQMLGFDLMSQGMIEGEGGGVASGTASTATLLDLLTESMIEGSDRSTRRKSVKLRLGFNGLCGVMWGLGANSNMNVRDEDGEGSDGGDGSGGAREFEEGRGSTVSGAEAIHSDRDVQENRSTPACTGEGPTPSGMNLAAALAVERQFRAAQESDGGQAIGFSQTPTRPSNFNDNDTTGVTEQGTPLRVSLMNLLEETDGCDEEKKEGGGGVDSMCCVCMGRKRGAAFIPCGHTFCRVCSRELWLTRGFCPLCNRTILEVLDIF